MRSKGEKLKIIFCRHGESNENTKGPLAKTINNSKLTTEGQKQTERFIPFFIKNKVQKVYYSPKERTRYISKYLDRIKIPHKEIYNLTERNWGAWGRQSWNQVSKKLEDLSIEKRYNIIPPLGESWSQFEERLFIALEQIKKEAREKDYKTIAIVTHTGCMRAIFPILTKEGIEHHTKFTTSLGSITVVNTDKKKSKIELFNYIPSTKIQK